MIKWVYKKERKPRTKEQKRYYVEKCPYYDGDGLTECMVPWVSPHKFDCGGSVHRCNKERYKWLASLSEKNRKMMMARGW